MNTLGLTIFCVAVAVANAGYYGGGAVISGPAGVIKASVAPGYVAPALGHAAAVVAPAVSAGYIAAGPAAPGYVAAGPGYVGGAVYGPGFYGAGYGYLAGSGHEGQYIPDYTEKLYDDGSYKPHLYGH
ncbi:spidroin-2-like [Sitophilus oryzae]|uniref:Spidroin-2-like n=1 Tax=Sitophilus oryzae TaxID=7048 RepID=A0A6J2YSV6_SITOR|nr:spidroin-2-like [Sitophilus oryzae]